MYGSVSFMSHPRHLLQHSSSHHTVALIPEPLEERVLCLESSAVDIPQVPCDEGQQHAKQETAT